MRPPRRGLVDRVSLGAMGTVSNSRWTEDKNVLRTVAMAVKSTSGPPQPLQFLAKKLLFGAEREDRDILLGTPIYVAMAD